MKFLKIRIYILREVSMHILTMGLVTFTVSVLSAQVWAGDIVEKTQIEQGKQSSVTAEGDSANKPEEGSFEETLLFAEKWAEAQGYTTYSGKRSSKTDMRQTAFGRLLHSMDTALPAGSAESIKHKKLMNYFSKDYDKYRGQK